MQDGRAITLHQAPGGSLSPSFLRDLRQFLDEAFDDDFSDHDWDHCLGGTHVWIAAPDGLVSHGSLVERTHACAGTTLRGG
jgi:aminoglycoside 2'-N-acetyltransferase I